METGLVDILEALLFSGTGPLSAGEVQKVFSRAAAEGLRTDQAQGVLALPVEALPETIPLGRIREAVETLREKLEKARSVYDVEEVPGGWRLVLRPAYAPWARLLRDEPAPKRLPSSFLETLAVVAYRQNVTRSEIEAIRGVSCDRALARLMELDLVRATGKADLPGRPIQYGTTKHFLEFCGIASLDELPVSDLVPPEMLGSA
jgi:segregation and condensation protein B